LRILLSVPITTEPPPNPPPDDTVRVRYTGTYSDITWGIGQWLLLNSGVAQSDLDALAADLAGEIGTLISICDATVHCNQVELQHYSGGIVDLVSFAASTATGGETGGHAVPAQVAYVVNWHEGLSYRGGHPRNYLPGVIEELLGSQSTMSSAAQASLVGQAMAYLNDVNTITVGGITSVTLGNVAFFRAGAALSPPVFHAFTAATASQKLGTQRRRIERP
jgi:hypothetical protein